MLTEVMEQIRGQLEIAMTPWHVFMYVWKMWCKTKLKLNEYLFCFFC